MLQPSDWSTMKSQKNGKRGQEVYQQELFTQCCGA